MKEMPGRAHLPRLSGGKVTVPKDARRQEGVKREGRRRE